MKLKMTQVSWNNEKETHTGRVDGYVVSYGDTLAVIVEKGTFHLVNIRKLRETNEPSRKSSHD